MKYVTSGSGRIPLVSLLAILSISLTINLPGLAVSPMLGSLQRVFHSSEMESQMLTSLPNMCMIPVVILAGRFATAGRQTAVLFTGLMLFLLSGIGCFMANSMSQLIVLGCLVGAGCGMVVPIAAGMISEWFSGAPRQRDLGLKSTVSNAMVIVANLYVGWVAAVNWQAAFAVYLLPAIPLCLIPFMTQRYIKRYARQAAPSAPGASTAGATAPHFHGRSSVCKLVSLTVLYMLLTYATTSISYYSPFLMAHWDMSTAQVGIVTAAYYAMCAFSGAFVGRLRRIFGRRVIPICLGLSAAGLFVIGFTHSYGMYVGAALVTGFGYGIIQPIIYNKTTYVAPNRVSGTRYFGYVLSANYVGIMLVPFIDGGVRHLSGPQLPGLEFVFSGAVVIVLLIWAWIERDNYVFAVNPHSAAPTQAQVQGL